MNNVNFGGLIGSRVIDCIRQKPSVIIAATMHQSGIYVYLKDNAGDVVSRELTGVRFAPTTPGDVGYLGE